MSSAATPNVTSSLDELCINTVRALAMDAVRKAESGHPGAPLSLAPLAYLLYTRHLMHNPADPAWPYRARLPLTHGLSSLLLYLSLHTWGSSSALVERGV